MRIGVNSEGGLLAKKDIAVIGLFQCIACVGFSFPKDDTDMAKRGFGKCDKGREEFRMVSATFLRDERDGCTHGFRISDAETVQKRREWLARQEDRK